MPAVVKSTVGSFSGTSDAPGISLCPCFLKKSSLLCFVGDEMVREKLQRYDAIKLGVEGFVHHTHPAFPELLKYFVLRYSLTDHDFLKRCMRRIVAPPECKALRRYANSYRVSTRESNAGNRGVPHTQNTLGDSMKNTKADISPFIGMSRLLFEHVRVGFSPPRQGIELLYSSSIASKIE